MTDRAAAVDPVLKDGRRAFQKDVLRRIPEHDMHGIGQDFYAQDAHLCPWSGGALCGVDHVSAFWRAMLEAGLESLRFDPQRTERSGALAWEIGHYSMSYRPAVAHEAVSGPVLVEGSYLAVLRHQEDEGWRVAAEMYTCLGDPTAAARARMPAKASVPTGRERFG